MKDLIALTEEFLRYCGVTKGLDLKTVMAYRGDLRQFLEFISRSTGSHELKSVGKVEIVSFVDYLQGQFKPKSTKRKVATVKSLFNYLEFEDYIVSNPFRKVRIVIKEPQRLPKYLSLQESRKVLLWLENQRIQLQNEGRQAEYKALLLKQAVVEFLFATGVRVSELCDLLVGQVNLEEGRVRIIGKGDKERQIFFGHSGTSKAIGRYYRHFSTEVSQTGRFFTTDKGRPMSPYHARKIVREVVLHAEIGRDITPHCFRHTFATLLLDEGVDLKYIQHYLGHSSILTTQIYAHVGGVKEAQLLISKHPRGRI